MKIELGKTIEALDRKTLVLKSMILSLMESLAHQNDSANTGIQFDILGHFLIGE